MCKPKLLFLLAGLLALLTIGGVALAQTSTNFDLSWYTFGSGGGVRQSTNYRLQDTTGLIAVAPTAGSSNYNIQGGFWYVPNATIPTPTPTIQATPTPTSIPTRTPTATPTFQPPTPTPPNVNPVTISPKTVSLQPGETQAFQASGGDGSFSWGATGGSLNTNTGNSVVYTAGSQSGSFNVVVNSGGANDSAAVSIGGLNIVALAKTQIDVPDTLLFEITNPGSHTAPFQWFSSNTGVATILPSGGGTQGELTAVAPGITEVFAKDDNGNGVESNRIKVVVGNSVEIPNVYGEPGKRAIAHINANTSFAEGVSSLQMTIQFDPNVLQAREALVTYRSANFSLAFSPDNSAGTALLLLTSITGEKISTGIGPILDLAFDVNAAAAEGTTSPLNFNSVVLLPQFGSPIPVTPINGTFEVCSTCLVHDGDVNGDNEVNIIDLQLVINIYLQRYTPTSEEFAAADMAPQPNGNDVVNVVDVLKVLNKILGKPVLRADASADLADEVVKITTPENIDVSSGESLVIPIHLSNEIPVGGIDVTLAYTQAVGILSTNPIITSPRGGNLSLQTNSDNPGFLQIILHSPDTNQSIASGSGNIFLIDFGTVSQDLTSELNVVEAAVSDVNGNSINFDLAKGTPGGVVYLPLIVK